MRARRSRSRSLNYGTDTSPEGRHGHGAAAAGDRGGSRQRRDADLPDPHLQGQGRRQLQRRRPELRSVQARLPRFRQAPVPELLVPRRAVQPEVLQARPSGDRGRLHGLPHARYGQRRTTRPARSPTAAATCRSRRSTCRASRSAATAIWTGSSRISTARSTLSSTSCSTASAIQCAQARAQLPVPDGRGRVDRLREARPGRRGGRGAEARHADARLHRPCGMPQGAHRQSPRRERGGAEPRP